MVMTMVIMMMMLMTMTATTMRTTMTSRRLRGQKRRTKACSASVKAHTRGRILGCRSTLDVGLRVRR